MGLCRFRDFLDGDASKPPVGEETCGRSQHGSPPT
jgi:hypothetical protein